MARKRGLKREDVVAAASEIADAEGLEAVTLAAVAERLRIRSPSLYAHVDGLAGLRRLLAMEAARAMGEEMRSAAAGREGVEALREIAVAYRRFGKRHPGLYQAAQRAVRPGEDDDLYATLAGVVIPVFDALQEAGIDRSEQVHLTRGFRSALHGFLDLEQRGGFGMPEAVEESYRRLIGMLIAAVQDRSSEGGGGGE